MDSFHWLGNSSLLNIELMSLWISVMFNLLLEQVLLEFEHYLAIYTFSTLQ
jgi:hypothetical protein